MKRRRRHPPLLLWVILVAAVTIGAINELGELAWGHPAPLWLTQVAAWAAILWTAWRMDRR